MDGFEGVSSAVYRREKIKVEYAENILDDLWNDELEVIAYVKNDLVFSTCPSEEYRTACSMMLFENFGALQAESPVRTVEILGVDDKGNVEIRAEAWRIGDPKLLSWNALIVMLNFHRQENYVMPRDIASIVERLKE